MSRNQHLPARKRGRPSKAEAAARLEAEMLLARLPVSAPAPEVLGAAAPSTDTFTAGVDANAGLRAPPEPEETPVAPPAPPAEEPGSYLQSLTSDQRNDPRFLCGKALVDLAHSRGIARSEMVGWNDDRVRSQLAILMGRQYELRDEYFDFLTR